MRKTSLRFQMQIFRRKQICVRNKWDGVGKKGNYVEISIHVCFVKSEFQSSTRVANFRLKFRLAVLLWFYSLTALKGKSLCDRSGGTENSPSAGIR